MTSSSRFNSTLLAVMLSSIGVSACSESDANPDGGDASVAVDAVDDWDGGYDGGSSDARDARPRDADAADVGVPDLGACGCSYGFQQQCAEDETCGLGFSGGLTCTRAEPFGGSAFGGCSMTATATGTLGAACTAQCVSALEGSPCGGIGHVVVENNIRDWLAAIAYATIDAPAPGPNKMRTEDIELANLRAPTPECGAFIKWTVFASVSLCRGEGAVVRPPQGSFSDIANWRFRHIDSDDDCQLAAASICGGILQSGPSFGETAADSVDEIPPSCPVLPYGAPCNGPDAQACLRNRLATMIRALRTPLSD